MFFIVLSKKYKKSYKKLIKSGRFSDIKKLENIINIIASGKHLDEKFQDHDLNGKMSDYRECHINSDLLLIYEKNDKEKIISLVVVGNHNDLFK